MGHSGTETTAENLKRKVENGKLVRRAIFPLSVIHFPLYLLTSIQWKTKAIEAVMSRSSGGRTLGNRRCSTGSSAKRSRPFQTNRKPRGIGYKGIVTREDGQIVFIDTPGVHKPGHLLNRRMMAAVHDAILSVDVLVLMRDASVSTGNGDRFVLELVKQSEKPAILVLNKIDKIKEKGELLPLIESYPTNTSSPRSSPSRR